MGETCLTWIDTLLWETFSRPAWQWDWDKTQVMTPNTFVIFYFVLAHCYYFFCFYLSSMLQSSFTSVYNEPVFQAKKLLKHFYDEHFQTTVSIFSTNLVLLKENWILADHIVWSMKWSW